MIDTGTCYQDEVGGAEVAEDLLAAVLDVARTIADEIDEGMFEALAVAPGRMVVDDLRGSIET